MQPQQAPFIVQLIPMVLIFGIFYFLVIRPEKKKQKDHKDMVANLKKNDEIVTAGGMHGVVVNIKDTTVVVRLDENVRVEFDKEAILVMKKKSE
jgi:preprotein translocase subunit YajC